MNAEHLAFQRDKPAGDNLAFQRDKPAGDGKEKYEAD
jgi:hypothetical protein